MSSNKGQGDLNSWGGRKASGRVCWLIGFTLRKRKLSPLSVTAGSSVIWSQALVEATRSPSHRRWEMGSGPRDGYISKRCSRALEKALSGCKTDRRLLRKDVYLRILREFTTGSFLK